MTNETRIALDETPRRTSAKAPQASCCAPAVQQACCEPEAKAECCGPVAAPECLCTPSTKSAA
jgi:hypothetical protein